MVRCVTIAFVSSAAAFFAGKGPLGLCIGGSSRFDHEGTRRASPYGWSQAAFLAGVGAPEAAAGVGGFEVAVTAAGDFRPVEGEAGAHHEAYGRVA